jgi:fumarate hydratase class II
MSEHRIERDSMGEVRVPANVYYGAQTQRAVENFPISDLRFPRGFIWALGLVKKNAALVNFDLKLLDKKLTDAIVKASDEVVSGKIDDQFVVDIFQTGSGTSTNMNANEVIASRANEILGGKRGDKRPVHPNDQVNMCQSSNDVIPTAIHIAALEAIEHELIPALTKLKNVLADKAREFDSVVKIGRTHLQDATPIRLGQEFGGYASMIEHGIRRLESCRANLSELAIGGTAVGTGINAHPEFARRIVDKINAETQLQFRESEDHFEAQGAQDALVETSGALKTIAVSLTKIANDIRWLGSGPRCGIGEIMLPETQPGSSIMPGKVNPVMCESVCQVAAQVIGNDLTTTIGGQGGYFELNLMMPVMAYNLLQSISILSSVCEAFVDKCVSGIRANKERCEQLIEYSLAMCTSLSPIIGYDAAAKIAKKAYETGRTVREIALEETNLSREELDRLLAPWTMTMPGIAGGTRAGG